MSVHRFRRTEVEYGRRPFQDIGPSSFQFCQRRARSAVRPSFQKPSLAAKLQQCTPINHDCAWKRYVVPPVAG
ncbi:unnamed protein product [Periconia digitata]|uniref:Uncharacterized protein n=1 Tax=Periconia digitata TaxID=1303443 RepID=A0A9W4XKE4_9PLEO|nr:unnamed protein product [Periconia digitata]